MHFIEKTIAKRLFDDLRAKGHKITVDYNEGEADPELIDLTDWEKVLEASDAVDDCWWLIGKWDRWVRLIWGNRGDCISDYSTNLEHIIAPIYEWIEAEKMV